MKSYGLVLACSLFSFFGTRSAFATTQQIQRGDTLSQIAESNYGNWVKWKDLWRVNRDHISNPNLIYPGQRLKLLTDEEFSLIKKNFTADSSDFSKRAEPVSSRRDTDPSGRSQEWRLLPQQTWEHFIFKTDKAVDPDGFDRRSKVAKRVADKTTAVLTIASDRIPIMGEISNARSEYDRLFLGDQIFIHADETLQVGTIYSTTTGPQKIVSPRDGRVGFGYDLTGKVRIIGIRDGLFIGTITSLFYPIKRHQLLIPEVNDYHFPEAIAAPTAIRAVIVIPLGAREDLLGQEKIVLLDAGASDGVKPGMIFRHYLHSDPSNQQAISARDFLIEAEIKVLSTLDKFSVAVIVHSKRLLGFGDDLVALTDLKDFEKNQGLQTLIQDTQKPLSVDDLDKLDANDGLGEKENRDLRQLENWSKPVPDTAVPNSTSLIPADEILKVETHDHPRKSFDIGKEPAPNDGTAKPETAPPENKLEVKPDVKPEIKSEEKPEIKPELTSEASTPASPPTPSTSSSPPTDVPPPTAPTPGGDASQATQEKEAPTPPIESAPNLFSPPTFTP